MIPEAAWDKKKKEVKSREGDDSEYRDKFRKIEKQRQLLLDQLNSHKIQPKDALEKVKLYDTLDGYPVRQYFEEEFLAKKPEDYNPTKYYSIFNKLEVNIWISKFN